MVELFIGMAVGLLLGVGGLWLALAPARRLREQRLRELQDERAQHREQLEQYTSTIESLRGEKIRLESNLEHLQKASAEKLELLEEAREKLRATFSEASLESLKANSAEFLKLAKSQLEHYQTGAQKDLDARQKKIGEVVEPLKQTLAKLEGQVHEVEKKRAEDQGSLGEKLKQLLDVNQRLGQETDRLVNALRRPQARGSWGELQLRRVVELAGMTSHVDFDEQVSRETEENRRQRPDMIIRMPNDRTVVLDSKAPMDAWLEASAAETEEERKSSLVRHARHVREHMRALGQKGYWSQFREAPDFVVLFLPSEALFSAALQVDSSLIEDAFQEKVVLATPSTLLALLRAVAYGWHQQSLTEEAAKVRDAGAELYLRISKFVEHYEKLGKHLKQATEQYNDTAGSLERRVLASARKLQNLSPNAPELPVPDPLETTTRQVRVPENA